MYQTSTASAADLPEILGFLRRRLLENAWVLWGVHDAFLYHLDWQRVVLCRSRGEIIATCYMSQRPLRGAEPKFTQFSNHYDVHMDALGPDAVGAVLETLPAGSVVHAQCFTSETKAYFDALPGVNRREDDLYFTVTSEVFQPVEGGNVVELTEADAHLFDGCERRPDWEHAGERSTVFAILVDGRAASWAWSAAGGGQATPVGAVSSGLVTINSLYTETRHRRRGLGRRLVSHITQLILQKGNMPIYWTEPDNVASQRLCTGLGYWQYAQKMCYTWTKSSGGTA